MNWVTNKLKVGSVLGELFQIEWLSKILVLNEVLTNTVTDNPEQIPFILKDLI